MKCKDCINWTAKAEDNNIGICDEIDYRDNRDLHNLQTDYSKITFFENYMDQLESSFIATGKDYGCIHFKPNVDYTTTHTITAIDGFIHVNYPHVNYGYAIPVEKVLNSLGIYIGDSIIIPED